MAKPKLENSPPETNPTGCLLRLCWMLVGNGVMLFAAIFITQHPWKSLSTADLVYAAGVAFLLGARFLDITRFQGTTTTGQPATLAHWRRYALLVLAVSACGWLAAHALAAAR
ncbi:MAG TPA: hypothetical protein PLE19_11440 [Planctomycetota bacterium]|nr:hypothetical protein [Planctomycetota bacterium]HRR81162.1 hypothetical protein [Planctomycetota bacterium]HRT94079.1 hypothetical protein [Planctomycetota bacterium]